MRTKGREIKEKGGQQVKREEEEERRVKEVGTRRARRRQMRKSREERVHEMIKGGALLKFRANEEKHRGSEWKKRRGSKSRKGKKRRQS